jgi:hypothetical protein
MDVDQRKRPAAICCSNSEVGLSLPHDQIHSFPRAKIVVCHFAVPAARAKGRAKIIPAKIQRNPLKRLDSHERIQGNPSFSNPLGRGFLKPMAGAQENPNRARAAITNSGR